MVFCPFEKLLAVLWECGWKRWCGIIVTKLVGKSHQVYLLYSSQPLRRAFLQPEQEARLYKMRIFSSANGRGRLENFLSLYYYLQDRKLGKVVLGLYNLLGKMRYGFHGLLWERQLTAFVFNGKVRLMCVDYYVTAGGHYATY